MHEKRPGAVGRARYLRENGTTAESKVWLWLRGRKLIGWKFRRQYPTETYILDFYCVTASLAVEVDGRIHDHPEQLAHDRRRTRWLGTQGIRVIRVAAIDVRDELDSVLAFIARVASERTATAGVALFVKQLGAVWAHEHSHHHDLKGGHWDSWPADLRVRQMPS